MIEETNEKTSKAVNVAKDNELQLKNVSIPDLKSTRLPRPVQQKCRALEIWRIAFGAVAVSNDGLGIWG